jgi:hypothetical protein
VRKQVDYLHGEMFEKDLGNGSTSYSIVQGGARVESGWRRPFTC